jgi:flagellar biosynthetic protein FliR
VQELLAAFLPTLPAVLLVFVRFTIIIASLPAPFSQGSPSPFRAALALFLAITVCVPHFGALPVVSLSPLSLAFAAFGEALVGAVIGLTIRVSLAAATMAGNIIGFSMGQGFAMTVDPMFGEQSLPTGRLFGSAAVLLFFVLGGHLTMVQAVAESIRVAPIGDAVDATRHAGALHMGSHLLAQGVRIASPVIGTMFLVQLGMGLVARSAPRVQIFILSFAILSAVGTAVLFASAPSVLGAIARNIQGLEGTLRGVLRTP